MDSYYYSNGQKQRLFTQPNTIAVRFLPGRHSDDTTSLVARRMLQDHTTTTSFIARYGIHVFNVLGGTAKLPEVDAVLDSLQEDANVELAARAFRAAEHAQPEELMFVTRRFLAQFHAWVGRDDITGLNAKHEVRVIEELDYAPNGYLLEAPAASGPKGSVEIANQYYESGLVKFAHPDFIRSRSFKSTTVEAPTRRSAQPRVRRADDTTRWHLEQIGLPKAWDVSRGEKEIVIAILDDGVDTGHPELAEKIMLQYDFESDTPDGRPKSSGDKHGTSCAGVATAMGVRASGAAPACSLMAVRTPSYLGVDDEARMFKWTADKGADVISCSWGPPDGRGPFAMSDNVAAAIEYCVTQGRKGLGIPIFFAAGNGEESVSEDGYASNRNVMAVGACTAEGVRSSYSDFGREVFICAPSSGGSSRIFTTDRRGPDGYNPGDATLGDAEGNYTSKFGGTSSAAPLVAGVAGLLLSVNRSLTCADVRSILASTAEKIGAQQGDYVADWQGSQHSRSPQFGFGRVHAHHAILAARDYQPSSGETGTSTTTDPETTETTVTGPESASRSGGPPTFTVNLEPGRYYFMELGSDPKLATTASYFASWNDPAITEPTYTPPASAWASLRTADRLYYRIWTTGRADAWLDEAAGPTQSLAIVAGAEDRSPSVVVYPSGATFDAVEPKDGVDRRDPFALGVIPLIGVAEHRDAKLAMTVSLGELVAASETYARISPELVRVLDKIRTGFAHPVEIFHGYVRPNTSGIDPAHASGLYAEIGAQAQAGELAARSRSVVGDQGVVVLASGRVRVGVRHRLNPRLPIELSHFTVTAPTIVGPDSVDDDALTPTLMIDVGRDRYYAVEVATDWRLLDARNARERKAATSRTFYATWRGATARLRTGASGRTVFRIPEPAWGQLREASVLYYRVLATSNADPANWDGIEASTPDAEAATAPRIRIRNADLRLRAERDGLVDPVALEEWSRLVSFRPPSDVQRVLEDRTAGFKDWPVHRIENAKGRLNLDYYSVRITAMPLIDGRRATPESLVDYLRRNINDVIDTNVCEFTPYDATEETKWTSGDPTGAVIHIDMKDGIIGTTVNVDDGSVVCAESTPTSWIFSTIWTTDDGDHPVSGNREFGVTSDDEGTYFYTRGADRPTGVIDSTMSRAVFGAADKLWRSLLAGVIRLCADTGGVAEIVRTDSERYDWAAASSAIWNPSTSWID